MILADGPIVRSNVDALIAERDALRAKVAAIEALHAPFAIVDDCDHDHADDDPAAIDTGYSLTCLDALACWACRSCCTDGGQQREDCATYHVHTKDVADRCATARILAGAP